MPDVAKSLADSPAKAVSTAASDESNEIFDADRIEAFALSQGKPKTFRGVFLSTFITIFLAEMGDKTQVTTLLMAAEFHAPWVIFAGAGAALIATSLVGVLLGQWLAQRISPQALDRSAGLTLLGITVWLLWDLLVA
ncbi:MAG: TMEM165/GDT1 family protein [Leptolyngbyaceae cyanobacterium SL_1_1]|nr:TMEM165/GDT1 family protein [Leptolyngbyaceae cyanobacterium RM1_1_2]NJO09166.1 TMEM165/GDT1 family protein [Leptolyngbyaceae cyanobacterium SL_1_1]